MFLPSIDKVGTGKPPANVHGLMKNAYDCNTFGRRQEEDDMLPIKNGSQARMNFVARYPQGWLGNNVVDANSESMRVFLALLTTPRHFRVDCNILMAFAAFRRIDGFWAITRKLSSQDLCR